VYRGLDRGEKMIFLITAFGKPFTPAGFGNAMRDWRDQANLHHCPAHGLRKACAMALAEAGATPQRSHPNWSPKLRGDRASYARRGQEKLADAAVAKLK